LLGFVLRLIAETLSRIFAARGSRSFTTAARSAESRAPDVARDKCERSAGQLAAFLLGNIPDLRGHGLGYVSRPAFVCVQRYHPQRPLVLAMQQVLNDGCDVRLGGVGLNIGEARTAEVAKTKCTSSLRHGTSDGWTTTHTH
jgi:hypothetical protein